MDTSVTGENNIKENQVHLDKPVKKKGKKKFDAFKYRAQEISEDSGIPYSYALKVAKGKLSLNEALLKLMRRDSIKEIMDQYALPSGIAASVLDKKLSSDYAVNRYQAKTEIAANRTRSCLQEALEEERDVVLYLFRNRVLKGRISEVDTYDFTFQPEEGEKAAFKKIELKYITAPEYEVRLRDLVGTVEEIAGIGLVEEKYPQNRNNFKHWKLMKAKNSPDGVQLITRDGDLLEGSITWFNTYEVGFLIGGDLEMTIFRHALHKMVILPKEESSS